MECDESCGCDLTVCKNRPISSNIGLYIFKEYIQGHKIKILNKDIKETFCWGIDYATHFITAMVLPEIEGIDKHSFIEKKLLKAVHLSVFLYMSHQF